VALAVAAPTLLHATMTLLQLKTTTAVTSAALGALIRWRATTIWMQPLTMDHVSFSVAAPTLLHATMTLLQLTTMAAVTILAWGVWTQLHAIMSLVQLETADCVAMRR